MTTVLALYNKPADPKKFDEYYFGTHVPIAKKIPGLLSYHVSTGATTIAGTEYHLVARLEFKSQADVQAALASPVGKAVAADLANFTQAGVTLLTFDSKPV